MQDNLLLAKYVLSEEIFRYVKNLPFCINVKKLKN